jgi:serine/threonine protein kinase
MEWIVACPTRLPVSVDCNPPHPLIHCAAMIGTSLGKYRLTAMLGQGGMATVYQAFQPSLDRYVAIKVLSPVLADTPGFVERFEHEAALVARLRHPNIVQVYDFDVDADRYYMVMELIEGPTLVTELAERAPYPNVVAAAFTPEETVRMFSALASAVDYAHARNMIHRDLKPANIMFTRDGQVILTDFGIARIIGEDKSIPDGRTAGTPAYMAPELCQGLEGAQPSDLYALGVLLYELLTGRVPFIEDTVEKLVWAHVHKPPQPPRELNAEIPAAVEAVILRALNKKPEQRFASGASMAQALREAYSLSFEQLVAALPIATVATPRRAGNVHISLAATPSLPLTLPPCPYRGLFAFREEDAPYFFGREDFTDRLSEMAEQRRLVGVTGPSGSGKSSVVYAGLLPRLQQAASLRQAQGKAWITATLRPGNRPFESIAAALIPGERLNRLNDLHDLAAELRSGTTNLGAQAQRLLDEHPDANRVLLVIDQFEETYTLCAEVDVRRAFLDVLVEGVRRNPALHIVFTIRADFLAQAYSHRPLADALQDSTLILGPMTRVELARAVKEPARKQGVIFEAGLIERILDDVGDEPGNLPLLEFALTALWDRQTLRTLTHEAYEDIGRVEGSLARYAEDVHGKLNDEHQSQARRIFVQMVRPGDGTEDTRRTATRSEIADGWPLAQQLADARLVVTDRSPNGEDTAEIVHEALIRSWGRLREWMRSNRNFRAWQERLRGMMQQWEQNQRDEGALLRGALLVGAEGWLTERETEIGGAERDFIRASMTLRERENAEREAQRQREVETAQRLAAAERQRAEAQSRNTQQSQRRALWFALFPTVAIIAAVLALILGVQAGRNFSTASEMVSTAEAINTQTVARLREAQARELAANARAQLPADPQLSLLLGIQAASLTQSALPESAEALRAALQSVAPDLPLPGTTLELVALARTQAQRPLTPAECQQYLRSACP